MKAKTINLQLVKNIGNYETIRLGGEWSVTEKEDLQQCMLQAEEELLQAFHAMVEAKKPKQEPKQDPKQETNGKQILKFEDTKKMKAVVAKIESGTHIDTVLQHFDLDEGARKSLAFVLAMQGRKDEQEKLLPKEEEKE